MIRYLRKKSISVFLVLCFLIISISTPTTEAISSIDSNETSVTVNEHMISVEETVPIVIDSLNKNECMIGEYVNSQDFNAAEHIKRLPDEEELDTYVFLNENGSKSVYYMDENVKYIDATGAIKEKDISLVAKSDGYGIARNEFDLHIPTVATSGIEMSYEGYTVKIIPQSTVKNVSAQEVNDSIVYDGFFGTNTKLKYTPMLSGIKEDVILETYIPNASFSFVLETDGLTLYNDGNDYWLAEDETSEAILHLGKIIIYDAVGKPEYGTMAVTTVMVGRMYVLSLSAPESYLTDPTTVYPVTIDPTLTVSDTATGEGAIEDTTLFSNRPSKNYGDYRYLSIGYVDSTYGVGRVAVKLPGLYNSNNYLNISASEIISVKFYCWDTSGNSAQMVNIYRITSDAWNENEVTYGDSVSYSTTTNWGKSMSNAVWTAFDITTLVRGWKTGSYSAAKGFIMVNPNETSASYKKAPYSSEYSNSSYRPYVVMTYDPDISQYYKAVLYGVTNSGHDHISCLNTLSVTMSDIWNDVIVRSGAISASTCRNDLLSTDLFTSRSHGQLVVYAGTQNVASTGIILDDKSSDSVAFYSHSWSSMSSGSTFIHNSDDYTGLNVALFIGCMTARGGQNARNLPSTIVAHGASASIGFSESIGCSSANTWTTNFYNKMLQGATLQEAVDYACSLASESSGLKSAVICGDSSIRLPIN